MVDEVLPVAPVEAVPAAAPAVEAPTSPSPTPETAVATEAAPVVETPAEVKATTVLGAEPEKPTAPEQPAQADAPKDEGQTAEPAPLPSYEAWTLPEGIVLEGEQLGKFNAMLGEFEGVTKADHAEAQKFGQSLVDYHIAEVGKTVEKITQSYTQAWEKQKNDWRDSFVNDPEIGGNRQETTVRDAIQFIKNYGGTDEQQAEFRNLMETTGIGNHPAMIRLLAKANAAMSEGKPLPATKPVMQKPSKMQALYGSS